LAVGEGSRTDWRGMTGGREEEMRMDDGARRYCGLDSTVLLVIRG
jgi:hypothetical protein